MSASPIPVPCTATDDEEKEVTVEFNARKVPIENHNLAGSLLPSSEIPPTFDV